MRVLVGEFSSYKAIVISKFFKLNYNNITVFTYDYKKFTKHIRSKYSDKHFYIDSNHFEEQLQSIINNYKIDFFFPVINDSLTKIWNNKANYNHTLDYLGKINSYHILNDKIKLHALAKRLNIVVPRKFNSIEDALIPYIIKPSNLSSSKGLIYVLSENGIPLNKDTSSMLIQQYVDGEGVGYSFYCKDGKISNGYGHKRLAEYPVKGGSSTYREPYIDDRMHKVAEKIVSEVNYTGFAMFEFKLTKDNELYLLEVNPRIWGSIHQGLINGVNYFEDIIGKRDSQQDTFNNNLNSYVTPLIYLSLVKYLFRFKIKPMYLFSSNFFNSVPDVSLFKDTKGYLSTILRKIL